MPHTAAMDDASALHILPESPASLEEALLVLRLGGIVIHATETCYGLACDLRNPEAVQRLFTVKQRPENQPVSALFSSIEEAKKYVEWNDRAEVLAKEFLPGPLTLILPACMDVPSKLHILPAANSATQPVRSGQWPGGRRPKSFSRRPHHRRHPRGEHRGAAEERSGEEVTSSGSIALLLAVSFDIRNPDTLESGNAAS